MDANNEPAADYHSFDYLLEAARGGDREALNRLISECREYLLLVANQEMDTALQAKLGASDLVQHTLAEMSNHLNQFRGSTREEFLAWLRRVLSNDLHDARRRFKHSQSRDVSRERGLDNAAGEPRPLIDPWATPSSQAILDEQAEMLQAALDKLPETHRQVIQLRNWLQLSFPEIGEQMGLSSDAARKTWYRAVLKLQDVLEPLMGPNCSMPPAYEGRDDDASR